MTLNLAMALEKSAKANPDKKTALIKEKPYDG